VQQAMGRLNGLRQQGVLQHAAAVAAHLRSPAVGLEEGQLEELFVGCPVLFSWAPQERAGLLFGQLMAAGLTAADAAACFIACPNLAQCRSMEAGLAELAAILQHSQDSKHGKQAQVPAAERTSAALLRKLPSACQLVVMKAGGLKQRVDSLVSLGCTRADVARLVWNRSEFVWGDSAQRVQRAIEVLQDKLGLDAAVVVSMVVSGATSWLRCRKETLAARCDALVEVRRTYQPTYLPTHLPRRPACLPPQQSLALRVFSTCLHTRLPTCRPEVVA